MYLGLSRQFGFAQFASTSDAKAFLERHYPSISLYGPYDPTQAPDTEAAKVRIAYSRDKDDRDKPGKNDDDWNCEVVRYTCCLQDRLLTKIVLPRKLLSSSNLLSLQCSQAM